MQQPSDFSTLAALLWHSRESLGPPNEQDDEGPTSNPLESANIPSKPQWTKSLIYRLKKQNPFGPKLSEYTNTSPGDAPPEPLYQAWFGAQRPRPIYALVIGINDYQHLPRLHGAVNDADVFSQYLRTVLKVQNERIVDIRNEQATRAGLLSAFRSLLQKPGRRRGPGKDDSIIIYYSGYGGQLEASLGGVQALIPWDYTGSADASPAVPAIASEETLEFLSEIKRVKGDHITVIFDCGGTTREGAEGYGQVSSRVVTLAEGVTEAELSASVVTGNVFVLSACSPGEAAREAQGTGFFTSTLVKLLKRQGSANITRSNILARLPQITGQTPQAHGTATDSPIFDTGLVPPEQVAYPISVQQGRYTVHAGSVEGITPETHFFVYRDKSRLSKKKPKVFVAKHVSFFTTTLSPVVEAPLKPLLKLPSAISYGSGVPHDLVIHVPLNDALTPLYQVALKLLFHSAADSYQFLFTDNLDVADISIGLSEDNETLQVAVVDNRVASHGFKKMPIALPLKNNDIEVFLLTVARFYRFLNQSKHNTSIGRGVAVEFLELLDSDTDYDDDGRPSRYPTGSNLFASGIAEIEINPDDPDVYGFKITNNTNRDLYAHIFYLDHGDLKKYHPNGSEQLPISKNGGVITIGYDNPGTSGYSYFVRAGQKMDIGFIKVLFSEEPISLKSIPQPAVFLDTRPKETIPNGGKMKEIERKEAHVPSIVPIPDLDLTKTWGDVLFCVVQRLLQEVNDV